MSKVMVHELIEQYHHTFRIFCEEVQRFDDHQWLTGLSYFQVPARQAMHILDCLDFYFTPGGGEPYRWGHRFGGGWWELADDRPPGQAQVLAYAGELEARIEQEMSGLEDAALAEPFVQEEGPKQTRLGHYVYALRHTVHHHGQLAALGVFHGLEGGAWD